MRATLTSVALLATLLARPAAAQDEVGTRRVGVRWDEGVPRVHFSAADVASRAVRDKLARGLPQLLVMRVYAYVDDGDPIAVTARSCEVTYDLWAEEYRVEIQTPSRDFHETHRDVDAVIRRCLVAERVSVGRASDYAAHRGRPLWFAVLIELNPPTSDTIHRMRRWLARPAGGGRVGGDAFFGSFVSLFVNRGIGSAERTLRFRSQRVRVRP